MRRSVLAIAILALVSGCVSPSERVPMNRGFQSSSRFGASRGSFFAAHPSVRPPTNFFAQSGGGPSANPMVPAAQLAQVEGDRVDRPVSSARRDVMPRFFPGLFGQGQGDAERLAKAKIPNRSDNFQDGRIAPAGLDPSADTRLAASASRDESVRETKVEIETTSADEDAPILPVGIKVEAYPVKPSPTLPPTAAETPRDGSVAGGDQRDNVERTRASVSVPEAKVADDRFLPIPGLDASKPNRPTEARPEPAQVAPEEKTSERPRMDPRETGRGDAAASNPNGRFRVTPKPGGAFPTPEPEPRRGPISRLIRRWRGDESAAR